MSTEIIIPHENIRNSQTITHVMHTEFQSRGLNMHVNEVDRLEDDFKKGVRVLTIKSTKYFTVPDLPWLKKKETMRYLNR